MTAITSCISSFGWVRPAWTYAALALLAISLASAGAETSLGQGTTAPKPSSGAAGVPGKDMIAVLDFDIIGSSKEQGAVLTNQLRSELLKTGRFTMVDRAQLNRILDEQALQQSICSGPECAVRAGRILGARKVVTGTVTRVTDTLWQLSVSVTDVETAEITGQEVINHAGDFSSLFLAGMASLAKKLAATPEEVAAGVSRLEPRSIAPAQFDVLRPGRIGALGFSPDSSRLFYATGAQVHSWNVAGRAASRPPIAAPSGDVTALAVNVAGDRLALGTSRGAALLADPDTGKILAAGDAGGAVTSVAFAPAGNYYAAGTKDQTIVVYYVRNGDRAFKLDDAKAPVQSVRFSPDSRYLISASLDGSVRFYDVNLQKQARAFQVAADQLHAAELSRDGAYVGVSARRVDIDLLRHRRTDTRFISIRDFKTGEELSTIQAHEKDIAGLAFFPDPRFVATGSQDGTIRIWDLQTKSAIANLGVDGRVEVLAVSANGHWLAAADDGGRITVWEVVK